MNYRNSQRSEVLFFCYLNSPLHYICKVEKHVGPPKVSNIVSSHQDVNQTRKTAAMWSITCFCIYIHVTILTKHPSVMIFLKNQPRKTRKSLLYTMNSDALPSHNSLQSAKRVYFQIEVWSGPAVMGVSQALWRPLAWHGRPNTPNTPPKVWPNLSEGP